MGMAKAHGNVAKQIWYKRDAALEYTLEDLGFGITTPQLVLGESGAMPMCRPHVADDV